MNKFDLDIVIIPMVCTGGVDVDLYYEYNCKDELHNILIQSENWYLYQQ